jgi:hypothetical protein
MAKSILDLYCRYLVERQFERVDLFRLIADEFDVKRVLYPSSFVHVTPSFVFPSVVYIDSDKQANKFFKTPEIHRLIEKRKVYPQEASFMFHFADYRDGFDEKEESFDLLISQYAGFVGQYCKPFLKKGGLLLANNSHGDAGVAAIDKDYQLIAVFSLRNGKYKIKKADLDSYFVPKSSVQLTKEHLMQLQKGISYTKSSSAYLFRKT